MTIGRAIGSELIDRGRREIVIGRDGRLSGPELSAALAEGLRAAGVDVIDVGQVATPMLYFAAHHFDTQSGVMLTGSHNPPDYNGLKIVLAGETLAGDAIQALRARIDRRQARERRGSYRQDEISRAISRAHHRRRQARAADEDRGRLRQRRRRRDCARRSTASSAATVTELVLRSRRQLSRTTIPIRRVPENLNDLIATLRSSDAEIGLAFDGDGDRLGVVTKRGDIIYPDRQLMLFAADVLSRNPGATIIYDVKSTRNLKPWIEQHGGKPLLWKTGHSFIKAKLKETGALLAGEMSGHVFFKERWYGFDDGLYAGARLLEILSRAADPSAALQALPDAISTPELQIKLNEGENYALIDQTAEDCAFRRRARTSSRSTACASNIRTASGLRARPIRRR